MRCTCDRAGLCAQCVHAFVLIHEFSILFCSIFGFSLFFSIRCLATMSVTHTLMKLNKNLVNLHTNIELYNIICIT